MPLCSWGLGCPLAVLFPIMPILPRVRYFSFFSLFPFNVNGGPELGVPLEVTG